MAVPKMSTADVLLYTKRFLTRRENLTRQIKQFDHETMAENSVFALEGDIQSGKTKTMLGYMLLTNISGSKTIVIVRNINEDCTQLLRASKDLMARYNKTCTEMGHGMPTKQEAAVDIDKIERWGYNINCNTLVVMANAAQLKTVVKYLADNDEITFTLFVDEADQLLHTTTSSKGTGERKGENVSMYMKELEKHCKVEYLVSATNYANYFSKDILTRNIIFVPRQDTYRGIDCLQFNLVDETNKCNADTFVLSLRLLDTLDALTIRPLYVNHPTVLLAKYSNLTDHHDELVQTVRNNARYSTQWTALSYNSDGITVYSPTMIGEQNVTIASIQGIPVKDQDGVFNFKGLSIKQALSYFRGENNEDLEHCLARFPRIAISAGILAGRCINFMDDKYLMHITDQYLETSASATTDSIIQSLRICGNHSIPTDLNVWCTEKTRNNIVLTYNTFNKYIANLKDNCADKTVLSIMQKTVIDRSKVPINSVCKIRKPYKVTNVSGKDNMDKYSDISVSATSATTKTKTTTKTTTTKTTTTKTTTTKTTKTTTKNADRVILVAERQSSNQKWNRFRDVKQFMLATYGRDHWVRRCEVFEGMGYLNNTRELATIQSDFTRLFQSTQSAPCTETTIGFLMKKENEAMYIRIN
jgi:hypothetical protein